VLQRLKKTAPALECADELAQAIAAGSSALRLKLNRSQIVRLVSYLNLLAKWNRVYNLTSIRAPRAMIAPHLLDSLSVYEFVKGPRVLDVGSGAGLPGIPLAVAKPTLQFVLLDSNAKKTRFIQQAAIELDLNNVRVEHRRIEGYRPEVRFDTVISRAFACLADFVESAAHTCAPTGRMLAMKAHLSAAEQQALPMMGKTARTYKLTVPGISGERQLIEISQ
jgi:16S rRNA (guanine527-N7)-methyltransferase